MLTTTLIKTLKLILGYPDKSELLSLKNDNYELGLRENQVN